MASRAHPRTFARPAKGPDDRIPLDRYVVPNANLFLRLARQAARAGDIEHACLGYRQCLATWQRANALSGGRWRREEERADREFSAFLLGQSPGPTAAEWV